MNVWYNFKGHETATLLYCEIDLPVHVDLETVGSLVDASVK